jgi:hypothetical protein
MSESTASPHPDCRNRGWLTEWFFAEEPPYGMALMRIVLPLVLLIDTCFRHPWAREFYSTDGAPSPLDVNFQRPGMVYIPEGTLAVALHAILIASLVTSSLGWFTRISLCLATILYTWFGLLDALSTLTKYTVIASHLLLLLTLSNCGALWSLDAWRKRGDRPLDAEGADGNFSQAAIWPARLVQLLVAVVYLGAAITKMHTPAFFNGDQLMYWTMTYVNNVHPLGDWLSQHPLVLSMFGYVTIVWEVAFLFVVFHPGRSQWLWYKWVAIAIGAFFHFMTMFTLGLYIFPLVMFASYLAFVESAEWRWLQSRDWLSGVRRVAGWCEAVGEAVFTPLWGADRAQNRAALTYGMCLLLSAAGAVGWERGRDPYQLEGGEGPLALEPMSEDEVSRMLGPDRAIRPSDKLLAVDLGTLQVGEHLVDSRREFRQGEKMLAQVTLTPPHEDLWLDCWLQESRETGVEGERVPGRSLAKVGVPVGRELLRANFFFNLDESLRPGEYFLRLRAGRDEIGLKRFTILPRRGAAVEERPAEAISAN